MKKSIALLLAFMLVIGLLAACGPADNTAVEGSVFYMNCRPEQDEAWQALARVYTEKTGVPVTVLTAPAGTYEESLLAEMDKSDAPTVFQVNGPVDLAHWKDHCLDLSGTALYGELISDNFALMEAEAVYGIGYVMETYGIICNRALLRQAGYTEADITDFRSLKKVAEDITARKDTLGFAAFASAGMDDTSDWRFKSQLANLPIYYEYENQGLRADAIGGTYLDNYRQIWDLYINNATCSPTELSVRTGADAVAEMVNGEAVFYQNGTWVYDDLAALGEENLGMLPIYIGVAGEEDQGLCTGCENYWCVNKNADRADIDATLAFLHWVVTSREGTAALADDMGFEIPFQGAQESDNPLVRLAKEQVASGKKPVDWYFSAMPSAAWKDGVGAALTAYAAQQTDENWAAVAAAFVDGWASQYGRSRG